MDDFFQTDFDALNFDDAPAELSRVSARESRKGTFTASDELRKKQRDATLRAYAKDPTYKHRVSIGVTKSNKRKFANAEFRAKHKLRMQEINKRVDKKQANSNGVKKRWQDPVYRAKQTAARKRVWAARRSKGWKHSEETLAKMRIAQQQRQRRNRESK